MEVPLLMLRLQPCHPFPSNCGKIIVLTVLLFPLHVCTRGNSVVLTQTCVHGWVGSKYITFELFIVYCDLCVQDKSKFVKYA